MMVNIGLNPDDQAQQLPCRRASTEKEKGALLLIPCDWIWINRSVSLRIVVSPCPEPRHE